MGTAPLGALLAAVPGAGSDPWMPAGYGSSLPSTLAALVLTAAALYLPGLALAQLLPAPSLAPQELRVAIAPVLSVVLAAAGVRALGLMSLGMHAAQLVVLTLVLWAVVWWRRSRAVPRDPSLGAHGLLGLAVLLGLGAVLWFATLAGWGLVLPNRDFKNHALLVAQIAATGSVDPGVVLQASPVGGPSAGVFYPLGLHTLLAWALPDPTMSTVGMTAAAAVVVVVVSLPLAVRTLARMWCPDDPRLPWLAGLFAVCLPGATSGAFAIGSVVLLVGAALFAAGLCCLWLWVRDPRPGTTLLLTLTGLGLFLLHVTEAAGLALVACGLLFVGEGRRLVRGRSRAVLAVAVGVTVLLVGAVLLRSELTRLLRLTDLDWDLEPNDAGPPGAVLGALLQQPVPISVLSLAWWGLATAGLWVGRKKAWSGFPALAVTVPLLLGVLAVLRAPALLTAVTAPWYGTPARVMLMAFPILVVLAAVGGLAALDAARSRLLRGAILVAGSVLLLVSAAATVPERRADLSASLAGAGDTPALARWLAGELQDGGTVLNLEADGTPLMYAYARVPVLSGTTQALLDEPVGGTPLAERLLDLDDPAVAQRLAAMDVRFLAFGITSRYWGQGIGYDWHQVAAQPEVTLVAQGDEVVVLAYRGGGS